MLSDEEKKAIEYLKQNSIPILRYDNFGNILSPLYYGTFEKEIILNLIEKQSKEIEELKNGQIDFWISDKEIEERIRNKFVRKDKIKAMLENEIINISGFECVAKEDVQSLLEKE